MGIDMKVSENKKERKTETWAGAGMFCFSELCIHLKNNVIINEPN